MKRFLKKLSLFWTSIAPGFFLVGYNIGTGSITTMAAGGAGYNMSLLWALVLSCLFTYIMVVGFSKYTIVTGETSLHAFKSHFGKSITLFLMFCIIVSETISCMGVMGVVAQVIQEWTRPLTVSGDGLNPIFVAFVFCVMLYYVFWQGKNHLFEKFLSIIVFIMGTCFLVTMFVAMPAPAAIVRGLIPTLPDNTNGYIIVAGMVGTTMGGVLYVVRSILVSEAKWTPDDMKMQRRDSIISVGMMFFLSFAVMACAAGTMYVKGLKVENAIDMVQLMEPLAGKMATSLFVSGIVCAGLSSLFPIIVLGPWLACDFLGIKRDLTKPWARIWALLTTLCGMVVPVFGGRPVSVMIISQSLAIISTPLVVLLMIILLNRKSIMGGQTAKTGENILYYLTLFFTIIISTIAIIGLLK